MNEVMLARLADIEQTALIDLWEIDLRPLGGELLRFCNQLNEKGNPVVWRGVEYTPYPIQGSGFEHSKSGGEARPKLTVSNLMGLVTAAAGQYQMMLGAPVLRRQTLARFLDAVNFEQGNPLADPEQEQISKFVVERLSSWDAETAVIELAVPSETDGATIPCRIMMAGNCCWLYRGDGCGYTGHAVADAMDMPTDDPAKDYCSGTLTGCRARFGKNAVLPFGGFPSSDKISA